MSSTEDVLSSNRNRKVGSSPDCDVAIIGTGPYGLSAAAHFKAQGMKVCVFGEPMQFWATTMPQGMLLRSPRPASNLSDPKSAYTLEAYETATGLKPAAPVPLTTFVNYGLWFQRQLGPVLNHNDVARVDREAPLFRLTLKNGDSLTSHRVVVAAGIRAFQCKPSIFSHLRPEQVSHCYEGRDINGFSGKRVAVIGAGQSALESAALLHERGADVEVIARIQNLRWIGQHGWLRRLGPFSHLLYSKYDVGPAGISRLVASPDIVYHFPLPIKDKLRTRAVRPAGAAWLPPRMTSVRVSAGRTIQSAASAGDEVRLTLDDGTERRADHVLLGTGYRVDISKYGFLSAALLSELRMIDGYPELRYGFRSSVPGLHFLGATAAKSFGPLLCFVAGADFACTQLTAYVTRQHEAAVA